MGTELVLETLQTFTF